MNLTVSTPEECPFRKILYTTTIWGIDGPILMNDLREYLDYRQTVRKCQLTSQKQ